MFPQNTSSIVGKMDGIDFLLSIQQNHSSLFSGMIGVACLLQTEQINTKKWFIIAGMAMGLLSLPTHQILKYTAN